MEDKFTRIARNRGQPLPEGAASNRLLHGGRDKDYRNKVDEFNSLRHSSRDGNGRPSLGDPRYRDYEEEYPETISIVLRKSHKSGAPPFLFTHSGEDQNLDFEGSDDDPEASEDENGRSEGEETDEDRRIWENLRQQQKTQPNKRPQTSKANQPKPKEKASQPGYGHAKKKPQPQSSTRTRETRPDSESEQAHSQTTDYRLLKDDQDDYFQPQSANDPRDLRYRGLRDEANQQGRPAKKRHQPNRGLDDTEEVRHDSPIEEIQIKEYRKHKDGGDSDLYRKRKDQEEEAIRRHADSANNSDARQRSSVPDQLPTERKNTNLGPGLSQSFVPVEAFNEMVAAYQAKIKTLEASLAAKDANIPPPRPIIQTSGLLTEGQANQVVSHLLAVQRGLEECTEFIEACNPPRASLGNRLSRGPAPEPQNYQGDQEKLLHMIRALMEDNECIVVDLQDTLDDRASPGKSVNYHQKPATHTSAHDQYSGLDDLTGKSKHNQNKSNENLEEKWLGRFNAVLGEPEEKSLEGVLARVRGLVSDCLSYKLKSATIGEKEKSMQRQINLSTTEFNRVSEEKSKIEGQLREQQAEINRLKIELSNNINERKDSITDTAKEVQKDQEISKLRRDLQEKTQLISDMQEEIAALKQERQQPLAIEYPNPEVGRKQAQVDPSEIDQVFEYLNSLILLGNTGDASELEQTRLKLKKGQYGSHIDMIERLIEMQAAKQEALSETFRNKFLNDNILMSEIKNKLENYDKLLEILDNWNGERGGGRENHRDLQDLAPKSQRQAIKSLIQDVKHMIHENQEAIKDAVNGDLQAFMHRHADADSYHASSKSDDDLSFSRKVEKPVAPQSGSNFTKAIVPYSPEAEPRRPSQGGNRDRLESSSRAGPQSQNLDLLAHMLTSQANAIQKY
jgi:hypothetical protein